MMNIGIAIALMALAFLLGALTFRIARHRDLPASAGGPPAAVLIVTYSILIVGAVVTLSTGIDR